jgi:phage baseplate assembly protein V
MSFGLVDTAAQVEAPAERRIYGVALAQVINNIDATGQGRVQVHLPWLPELDPWARVAVLEAGNDKGTYFIPQVDDEVLVAFMHGDVRDPYIIGSLWNTQDRPPAQSPTDAVSKRIIRTPLGHEIEFDDLLQSITVSNLVGHKITIEPSHVKIETTSGTSTLTLDANGNISLQGTRSIELRAPDITIEGTNVNIRSTTSTSINGGQTCRMQASTVLIN